MSDKSIASIANISEQDLLSFTPAMRQFIQIKRDNPTLLIMYRMGDFYETFFEDAELVHRVLGLTLTSPCRDQSEATKRSDAVEILLGSMEKLENINEFLKSIPDFERTATRIALGSVKPRELAALRDALPSLNVIAENLSDLDSELLKETAEELPLPEELYQRRQCYCRRI